MLASLNNYLLELTSLGVSNNPSAPPLVGTLTLDQIGGLPTMTWHEFLIIETSRNKHWGMTSLNYITNAYWNKNRVTIHKKYRWIHFEVTITSTLPFTRRTNMDKLRVTKRVHYSCKKPWPSMFKLDNVNVFVTLECIHLYILCIVPQCLFQDVSVMYLSHVMPRSSYREVL